MEPIAFELSCAGASHPIGGYGSMVALGIGLTLASVARAAHRAGESVASTIAVCGYTTVGGLFGAWLAFVGVEWAREGSLARALASGGGLVFYGAVPAGAAAAWIASRSLGIHFSKMLDLSVPAIAMGHALGRIGCFLGGCCYGAPWDGPFAVTFTHPLAPAAAQAVPRHPVQLYEAFGLWTLAAVFVMAPIGRADGRRAAVYVLGYALMRSAIELFRGDVVRGVWGPLSTAQIVSIALALGAGGWLVRRRGATARTEAA